ncbi:tape measure protein [Paenibacillus sp. GCM10027627]
MYDRLTIKINQATQSIEIQRAAFQSLNVTQQSTASNAVTQASKVKKAWEKVEEVISAAASAAAAVVVGTQFVDAYTNAHAKLALIKDQFHSLEELQKKLYDSAQELGIPYLDVVNSVADLGLLAKEQFANNDEMLKFSELVNKSFGIMAATPEQQKKGMEAVIQAMAAGRPDNIGIGAIMQDAPLVARALENMLGKSSGEIKKMAANAGITADMIKKAMFAAEKEISDKYKQMPLTFAQLGNQIANYLITTFSPVIEWIASLAGWIKDNWSSVAPIFYGLAAAVLVFGAGLAVMSAVTWIATGAAKAFFITLLKNPLFWVALVIGVIVGAIYKWIQSVGGLKIAWALVTHALMTAFDFVMLGLTTGIFWIINLFDRLQMGWMTVVTAIQNLAGDMSAGTLMILQGMVNGAIDIINRFIGVLNQIPGVSINTIAHVSFGTNAQLQNQAEKAARNAKLANFISDKQADKKARDAALATMKSDLLNDANARMNKIKQQQAAAGAKSQAGGTALGSAAPTVPVMAANVNKVNEVGHVNGGEVSIAEEDLKMMKDVAEMRYVQNFVTLTPTAVMQATINNGADEKMMLDALERKLEEEFAIAAEGVYA